MRLIALPKPQSKQVATVASETQAACLAPGYKTRVLRVRWRRQSCEQMWSPVAGCKRRQFSKRCHSKKKVRPTHPDRKALGL